MLLQGPEAQAVLEDANLTLIVGFTQGVAAADRLQMGQVAAANAATLEVVVLVESGVVKPPDLRDWGFVGEWRQLAILSGVQSRPHSRGGLQWAAVGCWAVALAAVLVAGCRVAAGCMCLTAWQRRWRPQSADHGPIMY